MAAIPNSLVAASHQLYKRDNFASREPGVIVVFCIVGAIAILLIALWIHKKMASRKAAKV